MELRDDLKMGYIGKRERGATTRAGGLFLGETVIADPPGVESDLAHPVARRSNQTRSSEGTHRLCNSPR